jgi:hypothetical protein
MCRFTALLGAMGSIYVGVDEGLAGALGKERWACMGHPCSRCMHAH